MSRASSSLEQEVCKSGGTIRHTTTYNATTEKASTTGVDNSAIQYYYACLSELEHDELHANIKVENSYLEIESVEISL